MWAVAANVTKNKKMRGGNYSVSKVKKMAITVICCLFYNLPFSWPSLIVFLWVENNQQE